jgi:hypothetical protein
MAPATTAKSKATVRQTLHMQSLRPACPNGGRSSGLANRGFSLMATLTLRVAQRIERIPPLIRSKMMAFVFPWSLPRALGRPRVAAALCRRHRRHPPDGVGYSSRLLDCDDPYDFAPLRRGFYDFAPLRRGLYDFAPLRRGFPFCCPRN